MIQLKNLRDELTGLVEGRFGSLQDQIDSLPDGSGTTPTPGNFVTLDGIQTIAGVKTFSALCEFINGLNVKAYSDAGGGQLRLMFPVVNDASPLPAGQVVCITFILNPSRNPLVNGNVWEVGTNYSNGNFFIRTGPSLNCLVINSSGVCNAVFGPPPRGSIGLGERFRHALSRSSSVTWRFASRRTGKVAPTMQESTATANASAWIHRNWIE